MLQNSKKLEKKFKNIWQTTGGKKIKKYMANYWWLQLPQKFD